VSELQRFVAFLGGINVGGHRAKGEELRVAFESLGHADVATFLASGNVVFDHGAGQGPDALSDGAERALQEKLGFEVRVYLRSAEEARAIAAAEPFDAEALGASDGKPQVILLSEPGADARSAVEWLSSEDDRLVLVGREVHWLPSGGVSESDLDIKALRELLGPSTTRTHNTIRRIAKKFLTRPA
jgi:uncharacterized protein (DUF1697 family)